MFNKPNFFPVNWMDGMKMNKSHFMATNFAFTDQNRDAFQSLLTPLSYGLLPNEEQQSLEVNISLDNQNVIKAKLLKCDAVTFGGNRIYLNNALPANNFVLAETNQHLKPNETGNYWISVAVNLFEVTPAGSPDPKENPPRIPNAMPTYSLHITADTQLKQVLNNPTHLIIGKVYVNGAQSKVDEEYIPACHSVDAHLDLMAFHGELDSFMSKLELKCSQIVQKIFKKNQQNELSDLVQFLCDRMLMFLGSNLTAFRWHGMHQPPVYMIEQPVALARVIKNTIDLRIGSGKEELLNYLSEWCDLNQGELQTLLTNISALTYQHHDINQSINKIIQLVKVLGKLFDTLGNLEFIGKKKDSNIFVKEEQINPNTDDINKPKPKRRFFAD